MSQITEYISRAEIKETVEKMANKINEDILANAQEWDKAPVFVCVLKGAMVFCSDLIRKIRKPLILDVIKVSSYEHSESTGKVNFHLDVIQDVTNRTVYLVEDIVDTGVTMSALIEHFKSKKAKEVKVVTFLHKPARTKIPVPLDFVGRSIDDAFVVGYGLDYDGKYRSLPYVGVLNL